METNISPISIWEEWWYSKTQNTEIPRTAPFWTRGDTMRAQRNPWDTVIEIEQRLLKLTSDWCIRYPQIVTATIKNTLNNYLNHMYHVKDVCFVSYSWYTCLFTVRASQVRCEIYVCTERVYIQLAMCIYSYLRVIRMRPTTKIIYFP